MEFVKDCSQPNAALTPELIERDVERAEYSGNAPFIAVQAPSQGGLQSLPAHRRGPGSRCWRRPGTGWAAGSGPHPRPSGQLDLRSTVCGDKSCGRD